ncbi:hypothetical protein V8C86DRAFT_2847277 [Haematococcus lacustris]|nr:hypothetical protein QJQ45_026809 [Haematococcus lacustris]
MQHSLGFARAQGFGGAASKRGSLLTCDAVKTKGGKSVACTKTLIAKPETAEAVAKLVAEHAEYSIKAANDRENGIIVVQAMRDSWEPSTFHLWERYESNAHMARFYSSPEYKTFMAKARPHLEQPIAIALYEYNNGQIGPVCLSEGPRGEGGLDDATGASGAAGGASMKQTSASFDLGRIEDAEEREHNVLTDSLKAAKKQMEGLKGLLGNLFGKKERQEDKPKAGAGKK